MNDTAGPHDRTLAAYQARLLDVLHDGTDGDAMADAVRRAAGDLPLGPLDATLLEVAADLTRTWGVLDQKLGPD